ncbi:ubiquitin carboxyl-terminal hydrolase 17-like protein A [Panulirus ornatus]|uniref:ubiquitin carboxyl-terminal hydrolase 17-like protein A n=1 Tax=Panulirus ornatus TaxID=150431 RepID=UPI003A8C2C4A
MSMSNQNSTDTEPKKCLCPIKTGQTQNQRNVYVQSKQYRHRTKEMSMSNQNRTDTEPKKCLCPIKTGQTQNQRNVYVQSKQDRHRTKEMSMSHQNTVAFRQDLLNSHYKERRIEWECRFCGTDHLCRHQTTLLWTPPVFIIHLSRYSNQKTRVIIPKDSLSLQGYMEPEHQSRPYELFAVVIHHGTTSSGHYTSCCRNQHGKTWRTYDDKAVHTTDLQRVLNDHVPHLLFYTQQQG